jgi:hypothetical protein
VLRVETTVNNVRDFKAYRFDDQRDPLIREPGGGPNLGAKKTPKKLSEES